MISSVQGIGMTSARTRLRMVNRLREKGVDNDQVLAAMNTVPRHIFLDEAMAHRAYEDTALPIGCKQTLSQPYVVAWMAQLLLEAPKTKILSVLEIGTGSGYAASILSQLVDRVYSVERIAQLSTKARNRFRQLKINNVQCRLSDGYLGWPEQAPFDGIVVAAAAASVPEQLMQQLSIGARLVIPIGDDAEQSMMVITRTEDGFTEEVKAAVRFVPMLKGVVQ